MCSVCACTEVWKEKWTRAFFELALQVLDDNVQLKRECECGGTVQFLSKHGFLIHWLIIFIFFFTHTGIQLVYPPVCETQQRIPVINTQHITSVRIQQSTFNEIE